MSRIALLTFTGDTSHVPEFAEMLRLVTPQRDAYCARHGYTHWLHVGAAYGDHDEYYAVNRLRLVRDTFENGDEFDLVWVLNIAAVITNLSIPITQFVDDEADFFIARFPNGLNAGSFIVRRSKWSIEWMSQIIELANVYANDPWHEQRAMIESEPAAGRHLRVLDHPSINQVRHEQHAHLGWPQGAHDWKPGDFVIHFPGQPLTDRVNYVRKALDFDVLEETV